MENRFKRLRYKDDLCFHEELTMSKLAEEMGVSKATIHNIESSDEYDAKTSILKLYHKRFPDISFDYLLGIQNTKERLSNHFEETLPFGNDFYEKLEQLNNTCTDYKELNEMLSIDSMAEDIVPIFLEALISDPTKLIFTIRNIYEALLLIRRITKYETINTDSYEYLGAQKLIEDSCYNLILNSIMPFLSPQMDAIIETDIEKEQQHTSNVNAKITKRKMFHSFTDE